jgi:hypothetical protein
MTPAKAFRFRAVHIGGGRAVRCAGEHPAAGTVLPDRAASRCLIARKARLPHTSTSVFPRQAGWRDRRSDWRRPIPGRSPRKSAPNRHTYASACACPASSAGEYPHRGARHPRRNTRDRGWHARAGARGGISSSAHPLNRAPKRRPTVVPGEAPRRALRPRTLPGEVREDEEAHNQGRASARPPLPRELGRGRGYRRERRLHRGYGRSPGKRTALPGSDGRDREPRTGRTLRGSLRRIGRRWLGRQRQRGRRRLVRQTGQRLHRTWRRLGGTG